MPSTTITKNLSKSHGGLSTRITTYKEALTSWKVQVVAWKPTRSRKMSRDPVTAEIQRRQDAYGDKPRVIYESDHVTLMAAEIRRQRPEHFNRPIRTYSIESPKHSKYGNHQRKRKKIPGKAAMLAVVSYASSC